MTKRNLLVALVAVLALVSTVAFLQWFSTPRMTQENCNRIKRGMSRAEVEAILGPPGDYRTQPAAGYRRAWHGFGLNSGTSGVWECDALQFSVTYDSDGHVIGQDISKITRVPHSPFEEIIRRVKRLWQQWFP